MRISCVISCSFRFLNELTELIDNLRSVNVEVLAPRSTTIRKQRGDFGILESDKKEEPGELQKDFMYKIQGADFHYAFLPDKRFGASVAAETCWAFHHDIPSIWSCIPQRFSESVEPEFIQLLTEIRYFDGILSPEELVQRIQTELITKALLVERKAIKKEYFKLLGIQKPPLEIIRI